MKQRRTFQKWHHTRMGRGSLLVLELGVAYILGSRAIDTGSIWQYSGTLVLLIAAVRNSVLFIRNK